MTRGMPDLDLTPNRGHLDRELDVFAELVGELDYPVLVVTAAADGEPSGCVVGFATQSSIEPTRFTVWISELNHTAPIAARSRTLVVHVLREHDEHLATLFGGESGDWTDKFAEIAWEPGPDGAPVLPQCDWFAGRVVERLTGLGDHTGYVLEPIAGERRHAGLAQLGYQRVRGVRPGHPAD